MDGRDGSLNELSRAASEQALRWSSWQLRSDRSTGSCDIAGRRSIHSVFSVGSFNVATGESSFFCGTTR